MTDTPNTMKRGKTEAETCRLNGWTVGTQLEGDEGYGPSVIQITAIGERDLLAKRIAYKGQPQVSRENSWTLSCREWRKVGQAADAANVPADSGAREAALEARIAELELACQRLRDDTQGAHAERDQWHEVYERANDWSWQQSARAEAAEAETAALQARIEALADEWEAEDSGNLPTGDRTDELRAALAGAPAVTPTETQAEGVGEQEDHRCDSGDFDRTIRPEPCGSMHFFCGTCGTRQDECAHDGDSRTTTEACGDNCGHPTNDEGPE